MWCMTRAFAFLTLATLIGCVDPQQACLDRADRDLRVVQHLIDETEANLGRGYAIERETKIVNYTQLCLGPHRRHAPGDLFCDRSRVVTTRDPVAIDPTTERRKLQSLKRKEKELQARTQSALASCEDGEPVTW